MRARISAPVTIVVALAAFTLAVPAPRPVRAAAPRPLPRVTFAAAPGSSILVHGSYPKVHSQCATTYVPLLHARFSGTIEVGRDTDGSLFVIGVLPIEDYLKGIAEVPRLWPMEALKAQAVAARSYALAHLAYGDPTGRRLGYQLCATDACQVYLGLGIADGPFGSRWRKAVDQTAGQALLYQGRPADAVYFSTSNGQTYGNEAVFGSSPLPYLRPVTERDDGASPLSHWGMTMPLGDLARFLSAAGAWPGGAVTSVRRAGSSVVVSGKGVSRTIDVVSFRSDLDYWSHCLDPSRYPGTNVVNGQTLPQTVPSRWFGLSVSSGTMTLSGRGWGHGVGMVQWGAEGKAARGLSYADILAAYYGGLRPTPYEEPSMIRVGIATGLSSVVVEGTGEVTTQGLDGSSESLGPGPWGISGGKHLRVAPRASAPPRYITAGRLIRGPRHLRVGRTVTATVSLPQLSVANLVLRVGGTDVRLTPSVTYQAGTAVLHGTVPNVPSGTYPLQVQVTNGIDIVRTKAVRVGVTGGTPSPSPSPAPSESPSPSRRHAEAIRDHRSSSPLLPVLVGLAALIAGLALVRRRLVRRSGGGSHRPPPPPPESSSAGG